MECIKMRRSCWLLLMFSLTTLMLSAQSVSYNYDELGRLVGVVDQSGNAARYTYDANGNVLSIARFSSNQVAILNFSPSSGPVGTSVTISGINFGTTLSDDLVSFNGVTASIVSASSNQIVAIVPSGATTGPINVGAPLGSATSSGPFSVVANGVGAPSIAGMTPAIGAPGDSIALSGSNFGVTASTNLVSINGKAAAVIPPVSVSALGFTVPTGVGSGPVNLLTPYGSSTSSTDLYIPPSPYTASQVSVAQRVTSNIPAVVTIPTSGHIGMLTFSGTAGQQASVTLSGSSFPSPCNYCDTLAVSILKPDGTTLGSTTVQYNSSAGYIDSVTLPVSGTYTVLFNPQGTATGSVTATVFLFKDVRGTIPSNSTTPGASATATSTVPGQNVLLTFSGTAGQQASLTLNGSSFPSPCRYCDTLAVSILKPDGTTLGSTSVQYNSSVDYIDSVTLPVSGTYTVLFSVPLRNQNGQS